MEINILKGLTNNEARGLHESVKNIKEQKTEHRYDVKTLRGCEGILSFTAYQIDTNILDLKKTERLNRLLDAAYRATKSTFNQQLLMAELSDCRVG